MCADRTRDGFVSGERGTLTDERLTRARIARREELAMVGEIVPGVAHELNNPLAGILGLGELVVEDLRETGCVQASDVESMMEQARRALAIVRDLHALVRPRRDRSGVCDLNAAVRAAVGLLRYRFCVDQVRLELDLDETLPALPADAGAIQGLVVQLLLNAQEAIAGRGEGGTVSLRTLRHPDDMASLFVEDDGPGVAPTCAVWVFDAYFTTRDAAAHSGLGLALARGAALRHGGDLRLDPHYRGGARFVVTLPLREGAATRAMPAAAGGLGQNGRWPSCGHGAAPSWPLHTPSTGWVAANDEGAGYRQGGSDGAA